MKDLINKVKEWAVDKKLDNTEPKIQYIKLVEEVGELGSALLKDNTNKIIDGIGDTLVVLIIICLQLNLDLNECLDFAYNEIKDRKGKTKRGVFIKDE